MEVVENIVDYHSMAGMVDFADPKFWAAAAISSCVGFLAPLPYNLCATAKVWSSMPLAHAAMKVLDPLFPTVRSHEPFWNLEDWFVDSRVSDFCLECNVSTFHSLNLPPFQNLFSYQHQCFSGGSTWPFTS
jgi:hypothetical protein